MFLARRPGPRVLERFLTDSHDRPLSYEPVGIAQSPPSGYDLDEIAATIGHGAACFSRAKDALAAWKHFDLGWVQLIQHTSSIEVGSIAAVLVGHLGFWSLNGCRVVYALGDRRTGSRFGFAYGTLVGHAERGEELFEVSLEPESDNVIYRIRAVSRPSTLTVRVGYPIARRLQARFRRDSVEAMRRHA
jgi:uncharacterized protein (UPF0548 family)